MIHNVLETFYYLIQVRTLPVQSNLRKVGEQWQKKGPYNLTSTSNYVGLRSLTYRSLANFICMGSEHPGNRKGNNAPHSDFNSHYKFLISS